MSDDVKIKHWSNLIKKIRNNEAVLLARFFKELSSSPLYSTVCLLNCLFISKITLTKIDRRNKVFRIVETVLECLAVLDETGQT